MKVRNPRTGLFDYQFNPLTDYDLATLSQKTEPTSYGAKTESEM